jgi:hypothetical protein
MMKVLPQHPGAHHENGENRQAKAKASVPVRSDHRLDQRQYLWRWAEQEHGQEHTAEEPP